MALRLNGAERALSDALLRTARQGLADALDDRHDGPAHSNAHATLSIATLSSPAATGTGWGIGGSSFAPGQALGGVSLFNASHSPVLHSAFDTLAAQTIYGGSGPGFNNNKGATAAQARQALHADGLGVDGTGIKVGVISNSFNSNNLPAANLNYGTNLPDQSKVHIVQESAGAAQDDEGRAMMQVVHDIAPGASLDFCSAEGGPQDFANHTTFSDTAFAHAILALAADGCKVICDDIVKPDSAWFQSDVVAEAIKTVEQQGVAYFSCAGNQSSGSGQGTTAFEDPAYQSTWIRQQGGLTVSYNSGFSYVTYPDALSFNGSPFESITLAAGARCDLRMQWAQPWGHATSNLMLILSVSDGSTGFVYPGANGSFWQWTNANNPDVPGESVDLQQSPLVASIYDPNGNTTLLNQTGVTQTLSLSVVNLSGPDPSLVKLEAFVNGGAPGTVSLANANAGAVTGWHESPYQFTVAAADVGNTPAFGNSPPLKEYFSASGQGDEYFFDAAGNPLASPQQLSPVLVTGIDDLDTSNFFNGADNSGIDEFFGTSCATPSVAAVAALMLDANAALLPFDINNLMFDSAIDMGTAGFDYYTGAGLVQADKAVAYAKGTITLDSTKPAFFGTHLNDKFVGGQGNHTVNGGGNGSDTIDYTPAPVGVTVNLTTGTGSNGFGGTDTYVGISNATGSTHNDILTGNTGNNVVNGGNGNDTINGGTSGNDTLNGGNGADTITFAIAGLTSSDIVNGGSDALADTLKFTTTGTVSAAVLAHVSNIETVQLANGTNSIALTNAMAGTAAGQLLTVNGGTGNDTVTASAVTTATNRVTINSGTGNDTLTGGAGADTFNFAPTALSSADTVNGGTGTALDVLAFTAAGTIVTAALTNVSHIEKIQLASGTNSITLTNALVGTSDAGHLLRVTGAAGNDTINAGAVNAATNQVSFNSGNGNDTLTGGAGADTFNFLASALTSADTVNGGTGASADLLLFATAGTVAASAFTNVSHIETIQLANGTNSIALTNGLVTSSDANHLLTVFGGTGNDTVNGSAVTTATNRLKILAGTGNDVLTGGGGVDIFNFAPTALTSADFVNGGTGPGLDLLQVSTAGALTAAALSHVTHVEQLYLAVGTNSVVVPDSIVASTDDGLQLFVFGRSGNDTVNASAVAAGHSVRFIADAGNDSFTGGLGQDVATFHIFNLTGSDHVNGGTGSAIDVLSFDTSGTLTASAFAGVSHVERLSFSTNASHNFTIPDSLVASSDDGHRLTIIGNGGHDTMDASAVTSANTVRFEGLGAADRFTSGAGADSFLYLAASDSRGDSNGTLYDTLIHFNTAADRIDLPTGFSVSSVVDVASGTLTGGTGTFDTNMATAIGSALHSHVAVDFHVTGGGLSGHEFLVINPTSADGYVSAADYVFDVTGHTGAFTTSDFI